MEDSTTINGQVRVYQLAKEVRLDSRRLIDLLHRLRIPDIRNHMSWVPIDAAQQVRAIMAGKVPSDPYPPVNSLRHPSKNTRDVQRPDHEASQQLESSMAPKRARTGLADTLDRALSVIASLDNSQVTPGSLINGLSVSRRAIGALEAALKRYEQYPLKRTLSRRGNSALHKLREHHTRLHTSMAQSAQTVHRCLTDHEYPVDVSTWDQWYKAGQMLCNEWAYVEAHPTVVADFTPYCEAAHCKPYKKPMPLAQALLTVLERLNPVNVASPGTSRGSTLLNLHAQQFDVSQMPLFDVWGRALLAWHRKPASDAEWWPPIPSSDPLVLKPHVKTRLMDIYQKSLTALEQNTLTPPLDGGKSPVRYEYLTRLGWRYFHVTAEPRAWGRFHIWTDQGEIEFVVRQYVEPRDDTHLVMLTWTFAVLEGLRCAHTTLTPKDDPHRPIRNASRKHSTLVRGHTMDLRGRKHPSPQQLELARLFRVSVPPGHTFCRPHRRGNKHNVTWHIQWDPKAIIHTLPHIDP